MKTAEKEARISSRINKNLKKKGDAVLASLGIKPSQALTMFYTQVVLHGGLPFDAKHPNKESIAAIKEDLSKAKRYSDVEKMIEDVLS